MSKIAVIGFGYWGKNLIRNFYELGVLAKVCDANASRKEQLQNQYPGVEFCLNLDDVLRDDSISGVAIATPAVTHYEIAKSVIDAGKDVFVEKPLSLTVAEGEHLVELADAAERILMVGHILHYHPAVQKLRELIQGGELGRVEYLYSNRLNIGKFRTEENILWSFAPHDISVMLGLLGEEPDEIFCRGGDYLSNNVADVTMSHFVFPSGTRAHIFVSWLHPFKEQRLVVVGSEKMAVFDDTSDDKLRLYAHQVQWINRVPTPIKADAEVVSLPDSEPLKAECQHFLDSIESRVQPLTDGREGLRVLRVLDACQLDLEQSRPSDFESSLTRSSRRGMPSNGANGNGASADDANEKHVRQANTSANDRFANSARSYFAHETAHVDPSCEIGGDTKIWHYSHVMKGAMIGENCVVGQNCCISNGVSIGDNVKIQNNVSVYNGTRIEDDVFLGPSCVLTNVSNPRSQVNRQALYEDTVIRRGATIGANATIVCGVEIGRYAFVAAGSVVTKNVPDYTLVMGNPAKPKGWMSRHGHKLGTPDAAGIMVCPESGYRYRFEPPCALRCLDLSEDTPLPSDQNTGQQSYRTYKS